MTKFSDLNLNPKVLKAIEEAGYETPTPIQAGAIPHALAGKDVLGIAQTGTGKTASFTLPMITLLARGRARAHPEERRGIDPGHLGLVRVEEDASAARADVELDTEDGARLHRGAASGAGSRCSHRAILHHAAYARPDAASPAHSLLR